MNILIVDDDRLVAISLKTIIEAEPGIEVVGLGGSGEEAIEMYGKLKPDILLMDIRMDKMLGLDAGEKILREYRDAKILFLTTFADDDYIVKALKIGAKGYLLKQNFESIVPSLKAVFAGQSVFGDDIVAKLPAILNIKKKADLSGFGITEKESELIELVAEGLSNKEIAGRLYLSEGTIRNSLSVIMEKLGMKRRTQLAFYYYNLK
jgi:DNA-binding NarL/FixJ family response regulator